MRRPLKLRAETLRVLGLLEEHLRGVRGGRPNTPDPGYTEPCITPRCSGEYTADCPY
jgi:hypothetical protein